jgi:hypothetical protein
MPSVAAEIEAEFERIRLTVGRLIDATLVRPRAGDPSATSVALRPTFESHPDCEVAALTLSAAYERYMNDPTHRWSTSTRQCYKTSRKLAMSARGADLSISMIGRAHCRDFLNVLRHLPRNSAKRFPKLTPREASRRTHERGDADVISAANANVHLANLSSFFKLVRQ